MKNKTLLAMVSAAAILAATPALALDVGVNAGANATVGGTTRGVKAQAALTARIAKGKERADQEVDRRITALNDLNTRVQAMVHVSASEKAAISSTVQGEVSTLTTLKAKIDADTDIPTLKTDIKSIAASYRVFMLVIPQGRIGVAADKIAEAATALASLSTKLQGYITTAQSNGKDVTALNASLTDMNAKIADANSQATAASALVSGLSPDNGDKTKMNANNQALKDARAKIQAALKDIQAARQDAHSIVKGLHAMGIEKTASSTQQ